MAADEDEVLGEGAPSDEAPSTSVSKERAGGQDSRAVARVGEEPDGPSTRGTEGRGLVERLAAHERRIQHKDLTDEEVTRFLNPPGKGRKE